MPFSADDLKNLSAADVKPVAQPEPSPSGSLSSADLKGLTASDFHPLTSSDLGSLKASDFQPVGGSPAPQPAALPPQDPHPTATPHRYDQYIIDAAKEFGIDKRVLQGVGIWESGLGRAANYDEKTGLDRDGNPGHGLFQLDPSSGASQSELDQAARDPKFASRRAAKTLAGLIAEFHGNVRMALAAYNAGSEGARKGLGQDYANHVFAAMDHAEALRDPGTMKGPGVEVANHIVATAKRMHKAAQAGKDPIKVLSHDSYLTGARKLSNQWQEGMLFFKQHPVEALGDVLGGAQRAVGQLAHEVAAEKAAKADALAHHRAWDDSKAHSAMLEHIHDAVFHPNARYNEQSTEGVTELANSFGAHVLPSNGDIDHMIRANSWGILNGLKPAAATTLKTANDIGRQIISDPLTYVGGLGIAERAFRGVSGVAHAAWEIAGHQPAFSHLYDLGNQLHEIADRAFGVRRDLDAAGFTRRGKEARLGIENAAISQHAQHMGEVNRIKGDADAAADFYGKHYRSVDNTVKMGAKVRGSQAYNPETITRLRQEHAEAQAAAEQATRDAQRLHDTRAAETQSASESRSRRTEGMAEGSKEYQDAMRRNAASGQRRSAANAKNREEALRRVQAANKRADQAKARLEAEEARQAKAAEEGEVAYPGGITEHAQNVQKLSDAATPVEEREKILKELVNNVRDTTIHRETLTHLANDPNLYLGTRKALGDLGTEENSKVQAFLDAAMDLPVFRGMRDLGKRAIMWNFIPHGIKNVGENVFMNGGLGPVVHGIKSMATGVDPADLDRLRRMGAMPDYVEEEMKNGNNLAGKLTQASNAGLHYVESGWRAGLMHHLDGVMGKPTSAVDEYVRGALINRMVGDYRNQSAFVKFFQGLGGPFVAFRLGIVPQTFLKALAFHPERILAIARGQMDFNNERNDPGHRQNHLEIGGPIKDGAEMLEGILNMDPDYLKKSLGLLAETNESPKPGDGNISRFLNFIHGVGEMYFPQFDAAESIAKPLMGLERPGQNPPLHERLEDLILSLFGSYFKKEESGREQVYDHRAIVRGTA